jgi:hypothetical protein
MRGFAPTGPGRKDTRGPMPRGLPLLGLRAVADHKQIIYERYYVKVPGSDRLRKNAAGRLRHLLASGWREMGRTKSGDYIEVHLERTGVPPPFKPRPAPAQAPRERRTGFGQGGGDRRGPRR